ncbi:proline-rich protein HaeIII subfamily 1-like [Haliaeetus albicilla]|uniref:proline-rich protein HaeIII subfamily 1-like n=1 Tax=Haliaeetus albicilla TaxID=8969 RepID=UPI0037E7285E
MPPGHPNPFFPRLSLSPPTPSSPRTPGRSSRTSPAFPYPRQGATYRRCVSPPAPGSAPPSARRGGSGDGPRRRLPRRGGRSPALPQLGASLSPTGEFEAKEGVGEGEAGGEAEPERLAEPRTHLGPLCRGGRAAVAGRQREPPAPPVTGRPGRRVPQGKSSGRRGGGGGGGGGGGRAAHTARPPPPRRPLPRTDSEARPPLPLRSRAAAAVTACGEPAPRSAAGGRSSAPPPTPPPPPPRGPFSSFAAAGSRAPGRSGAVPGSSAEEPPPPSAPQNLTAVAACPVRRCRRRFLSFPPEPASAPRLHHRRQRGGEGRGGEERGRYPRAPPPGRSRSASPRPAAPPDVPGGAALRCGGDARGVRLP